MWNFCCRNYNNLLSFQGNSSTFPTIKCEGYCGPTNLIMLHTGCDPIGTYPLMLMASECASSLESSWFAIYSLLVQYNVPVVRPMSVVDYLSWLSGIPLMCRRPLDTYMYVDYLNFADCRISIRCILRTVPHLICIICWTANCMYSKFRIPQNTPSQVSPKTANTTNRYHFVRGLVTNPHCTFPHSTIPHCSAPRRTFQRRRHRRSANNSERKEAKGHQLSDLHVCLPVGIVSGAQSQGLLHLVVNSLTENENRHLTWKWQPRWRVSGKDVATDTMRLLSKSDSMVVGLNSWLAPVAHSLRTSKIAL